MIFIHNEGITDPHINLALEEYALRNFDYDHDYLLFYINEPSIIIGRNQNTLEEINHEYVEEKGIHVVRRISGGGAVYHDVGNLNFSFITDYDKKSLNNFKKFTAPIVRVLNTMGIDAELSGRNDLQVEGRKISGNAQFSSVDRMFSHGTLLFDSDLDEVTNALDVKMSKIESKGHKSVRSRVANISEFMDEPIDTQTFRKRLLEGLYKDREEFETYHLTESEWKEVHALKDEKYGQWDWNFGKSPKFNIQRSRRFDAGEIDLRLDVDEGHIDNVKIYGDFFGKEPVAQLEEYLQGVRYDRQEVENKVEPINIEQYFGAVPKSEFIELVYGADA
ncbi:lipoate--protein ligase [Aliifodinibius salipaludis]|uniref:lipoate--protein ligase n=1 Tax=Fodinibius salipaludis TaxID=2032627 RepID=A0A2A2GC32_9BACT|nr:lipoate--protein ligase [Aliifodinibius salipaludis]PAU95111.1 lipoate--protein ligase [Aliifodinibius salipaludis]